MCKTINLGLRVPRRINRSNLDIVHISIHYNAHNGVINLNAVYPVRQTCITKPTLTTSFLLCTYETTQSYIKMLYHQKTKSMQVM